MRRKIINIGANRNNTQWIHRRVASVIVELDVIHVDGATHAWDLKDVLCVVEQIWILPYKFPVTLEKNCIDLLKFKL